jgi:GTP-binding protein
MNAKIRNVAMIAHVDHGKTTLVDALLVQSKTALGKGASRELIMDSDELERERGITIFSKNASVVYEDVKINIIDTPGHADFGGEVERVLKMADGVLLLVDAQEGPMPQTRFVLKKALTVGHTVIVVINKVDKPNARPGWALEKTYELFIDLGATDEQIEFPVIYAAAKLGKAGATPELTAMMDISPIFRAIVRHVPAPTGEAGAPFQLLVTSLASDAYRGKIGIGRVARGSLASGATVAHVKRDGTANVGKVTALMTFEGLDRVEVPNVTIGDIVAVAGLDVNIGDTIADEDHPEALPTIAIEQPTVKMTFGVNTSPFAGDEGEYGTSRNLAERLMKELDTDVALKVESGSSDSEFVVSGRGELHLSILIERMRREGYELQVSRPEVIITIDEHGRKLEPVEDVWIEAAETYTGIIIDKLGRRKGELKNMRVDEGTAHFHFSIPTRSLIGYRNEFLADTRGTGMLNALFAGLAPLSGEVVANSHGSLIAFAAGATTTYGLVNAQERGVLFVGPGEKVYVGQVVGQAGKDEDLEVNVCKTKKLSNMRSKGEGVTEGLDVPKRMGLEDALEYINDDELVEVTPKSIRVRKKLLSALERKRVRRPDV